MIWYVVLCEGRSEKLLIERLLDDDSLSFDRSQIISGEPVIRNKIKLILPQVHTIPPDEQIIILRVGDTLNDAFLPQKYELSYRLSKGTLSIDKACTKPEIEILIIIANNKLKEYKKADLKPKGFVKGKIKESKKFIDFLDSLSKDELIQVLLEYRSLKGKSQKEKCVADFLKSQCYQNDI